MNVTIFGASTVAQDDPLLDEAYRLGALLAKAGHTVITGGYIGTMEAASRGAAEAGGHTIGVTCEEIERWRKVRANAWVKEEWRLPTLHERIIAMQDSAGALIALPGGPGTLTEVSMAWNRLAIESTTPKPLILIGPGWKAVCEQFFASLGAYTAEPIRALLSFAETVEDAVALLPATQPSSHSLLSTLDSRSH